MKVLVFDFETTGFIPEIPFLLDRPEYLEQMPHAVQLAFSVSAPETTHYNYYLKINVPIDNVEIHGVTEEMSLGGVDFTEAFDVFSRLYQECDKVVSHNIDFDTRVFRIECARRGIKFKFDDAKLYCTMKEGAKQWGRKKWPKLTELYEHFYQKTPLNMHDASADVKACLRCYGALTSTPVPSAEELELAEA
jgi:DNA polymerase III subunit epsilon